MKKSGILVLSIAAVLCLAGCGDTEKKSSDDISIGILESMEDSGPEASVGPDVAGMLDEAEQEAALLEKKLAEDASLTQADMNELSNEIYMVWDDLLNELWGILKERLEPDDMEKLLQEQRAWITEKEAEVKAAGEEYGGGSMAVLAANQKAAELTQARVSVLAEYLQEK